MTHPFYKRLEKDLAHRRDHSLLRNVQPAPKWKVDLTHNDYLNLRRHPEVVKGAMEAVLKYGSGTGASPLLGGFKQCHQKLQNTLLEWLGKSHGIIFNTGFAANQAILKQLPGPQDVILIDRLAHHSLIQPLMGGGKRFHRYRHGDLTHLEELLYKHHNSFETTFVITESVFSMDGDATDLPGLIALKHKYPFVLVLDEAHALGVYGRTGAGLAEEMGMLPEVDILMGTFGKALGSMGAFIVSDHSEITQYLANNAGEFIYSTYLAPPCIGAARAALDQVKALGQKRRALRQTGKTFRELLIRNGWETLGMDSQIVPLILRSPEKVLSLQSFFQQADIGTAAIRPPTVPEDTSRIRFSLNSNVTEETVDHIMDQLCQWNLTRS